MKRLLFISLVILEVVCHAQSIDTASPEFITAVGRYPLITVPDITCYPQGLAVWEGRYAFCFYHKGSCVVVDLLEDRYLGDYNVPCASQDKAHSNNAGFGTEYFCGDSMFPLLYLAECGGENKCYVLDVYADHAQCVQILRHESDTYGWFDWTVDRETGCIYTFGTRKGTGMYVLKKFRIPGVSDGQEVVLTDNDVLAEIELGDRIKISQGTAITEGRLFAPHGTYGRDIAMHIYDVDTGKEIRCMDMNDMVYEPEGCCVSEGSLYQFFNTSGRGTIYRFQILK